MLARDTFPFVDADKLQNVAILCHRHADADAYLSAYAMVDFFSKISPRARVDIITPEGMGSVAQRLREAFSHETLEESGRNYDLFVAVDIGHTELLKDWLAKITTSRAFKILLDHHPQQKASIYDRSIVNQDASSAAEIVYSLFRGAGIKPEKTAAQALLVGILSDSQHLAIASENTVRAVVELLDHGANLNEARRILRSPPDYGEVIAKLKGAKRTRTFRVGDWVVVTSHVGSYQANVARALVGLGADVAVVAGDFDGETRASFRANQRFYDATKLHLGVQVAEVIAGKEGYGGGHPTAASFTCKLGEDGALDGAVALLSKLLGATPVEVR